MARVDYDEQSGRYDRGRTLPDEAISLWMANAKRYAGDATSILDLGAGTGRFSAALADTFDAPVVAVEPSVGMRDQATTKTHARVKNVAGHAEHIPLRDATVDLAWLSNVVHHFDDLDGAAAELRRVVASGGAVLVRGAFGDTAIPSLYRFFPGTQKIIESFPTRRAVIDAFDHAGFTSFYEDKVDQLLANSLAEMVPRMKLRADTTLELITDEEFEAGIRLLEETAEVETGPVIDALDLLVIR